MPTKKILYTPDFQKEILYKGSNLSEHTKLATGEQINGIDLANLVGPAGSNGTNGAKGDDGDQGIQGAKGNTGSAGGQGEQGDQGIQGNIGAPGLLGPTGAKGDDGIQGAKGNIGNTGAAGSDGDDGATGGQGIQGVKGNTGNTGAAGTNGTNGSTGAKGDKGNTGNTGAAGSNGSQGVMGERGAPGSDGATGPQGPAGLLNVSTQTVYGTKTFNNSVYAPDFIESSDRELKNVRSKVKGKSLALKLNPITYTWKKGDTKSINLGFVAQEVHEVSEALVNTMPNGFLGVKYSKVVVLNNAAIQEHDKEIQELRKMVTELQNPKQSRIVKFLIKIGL